MAYQPGQKFRILYCTSEEEGYGIDELLKQPGQGQGWQSERFCDYPQEIVIQFQKAVQIKQIQFLSHQSKISSKIEIYTYIPNDSKPIALEHAQFTRLGYMTLSNNEQSGFQARELKSVYIDNPCLYLKLVLNKCHNNKFNPFNQVSLIGIKVIGDTIENYQTIQQLPPVKERQMQLDPVTAERIKSLEKAKARAIDNEDFDEAKRIKEIIQKLTTLGDQFLKLDERKRIAIQNEDFDMAKAIKQEIDELRNSVMPAPQQFVPQTYAPFLQTKDYNIPKEPEFTFPNADDRQIPTLAKNDQYEIHVIGEYPICMFCGKADELFQNQDNIDIHWWKDCPMLVDCQLCNQIVEIVHLNIHLIQECELKDVMKQCERCKEAVHVDEYEQHMEEQSCNVFRSPEEVFRCVLCHEDVETGPEGWMKHILEDGCPNNDRSNY